MSQIGAEAREPKWSGSWLQANGQTADAIRASDWSGTSLGPLEYWPPTLRTTLNLVLNSPFSIFVAWGEDWRCFYNDAYAPMLAGKERALGCPVEEVFPEFYSKIRPMLTKAMQGVSSLIESLSVPVMRDGELCDTHWVVSYSPICDETGAICGVFIPLHEVTAKLQAEEARRKSEENLQIMSNIVPGFLWRYDGSSHVWTNQRMKDTLSSLDPSEIVHHEDQASLSVEWARAQREGNRFHHYHRLKMPDGSYRWHVALAEPVQNAAGEIEEWFGMATDIHDYRDASDRLARKSALLHSFIRNAADVIWILDVESRQFDYLSPSFAAIWDRPPADQTLDWDTWLSMLHPDDRDHHALTFDRLLNGEVLHEQYRIQRPDGSVRWIRDTMFPIIGPDGTVQRLGGIARDITRQNGKIVYLIDSTPEGRSCLSHRIQKMGFQVRPFRSIEDFMRLSRALLPGCVVCVDAQGGAQSDRLAAAMKGQCCSLPLVLVCEVSDASKAIQLMKQGVNDIILADDLPERLDQAIASALAVIQSGSGESSVISDARERVQPLSDREREILQCLSNGATNKMVARDLGLSPRTVETYRVRVLEKLGVSSLPEAVRIATLAGL